MYGNREKKITWMLGIGICMIVGGLILGTFMYLGAMGRSAVVGSQSPFVIVGIMFLIAFAGVLLTGYAVFFGLATNRKMAKTTEVVKVENMRVRARYAINHIGETIFSADEIDWNHPKTRLFVRVEIPGQGQTELRCNPAVWGQAAELMTGTGMVQGDWLGSFEPAIGRGQGNPYE